MQTKTQIDTEHKLQAIESQLGVEAKDKGSIAKRLDSLETDLAEINKKLTNLGTALKTHTDKQTAEIRVLPKGKNPKMTSDWDDYSGVFYVDKKDDEETVLKKALKHYEHYFETGHWHKGKTLGLFLNGLTGKKLIKTMKTHA